MFPPSSFSLYLFLGVWLFHLHISTSDDSLMQHEYSLWACIGGATKFSLHKEAIQKIKFKSNVWLFEKTLGSRSSENFSAPLHIY